MNELGKGTNNFHGSVAQYRERLRLLQNVEADEVKTDMEAARALNIRNSTCDYLFPHQGWIAARAAYWPTKENRQKICNWRLGIWRYGNLEPHNLKSQK